MSLHILTGRTWSHLGVLVAAALLVVVAGCATPDRAVLELDRTPGTDHARTFGLFGTVLPAATDGRHVFILRPEWATQRDGAMQWSVVLPPEGVSPLTTTIEIYNGPGTEAAGTWRVVVTPTISGVPAGPSVTTTVTYVSAISNGVAKQTAALRGFTGSREYLVTISAAGDTRAERFVLATVRVGGERQ